MSQLEYLLEQGLVFPLKEGNIRKYDYGRGGTLVRLAQCCGCVARGTLPYQNLWTKKKPKAKWNQKQLYVVGYAKRKPKVDSTRGVLRFDLKNNERFYITWENS